MFTHWWCDPEPLVEDSMIRHKPGKFNDFSGRTDYIAAKIYLGYGKSAASRLVNRTIPSSWLVP